MKKAVLLTIAATGLIGSSAFARVDSRNLTCAEARNVVQSQGAVVMTYGEGPGGLLFDRFVAHRGYCMQQEETTPAWIPTSDTNQCLVGYRCEERDNND